MFNYLSWVNDYGLIDKILTQKNRKQREKEIGDKLYKIIEYQTSAYPVWVCFLPWGVKFDEAKKIGIIPKSGKVICFEGPVGIANPDPNVTKILLQQIINDLDSLNLSEFNVLALSIGNYLGYYVANHFNVKKLVSVVPGSKLGACIYDGIASQEVRKRAVLLNINSSEEYDAKLTGTNPIENLNNLPEDIEIHIATHDFFIPTVHGEELIQAMIKNGKNPKIFRYKKGHVLTLAEFGKCNPY